MWQEPINNAERNITERSQKHERKLPPIAL